MKEVKLAWTSIDRSLVEKISRFSNIVIVAYNKFSIEAHLGAFTF